MTTLSNLFIRLTWLIIVLPGLITGVHAQSNTTYFNTPYQDSGINFSASKFHQVLPLPNGSVTLGLTKTISLSGMCSGPVASFKDLNGKVTSFHRYHSCDSVASWAPTGVITSDGFLVMAYMGTMETDVSDYLTNTFLYIVKVSLNDPSSYTTKRITITDGQYYDFAGFQPGDEKSTRIVQHPNGDYSILIPAHDRLLLCRLNSSFQVLNTVKYSIPFQTIDRTLNTAYSSLLALPGGDVLVNIYYEIGLPLVEGGMMISKVSNTGTIYYTKTYECSAVAGPGMISFPNQMQLISGQKVMVAANSQSGASVYQLNTATGEILNAKFLLRPGNPGAPLDSNLYTWGNIGIERFNNDYLLHRIVTNYSTTIPDQVGIIKVDSNLNLKESIKFHFNGAMSLIGDGLPLPCKTYDGSGMLIAHYANGMSTDSSFGESGELLYRVDPQLRIACTERAYSMADIMIPEIPLNPYNLAINIGTENLTTTTVPIDHTISTAYWQRNVCRPISGAPTTAIRNINRKEATIYPNPVQDYLTIDINNAVRAEIFNITGSKVADIDLQNSNKADCSSFTPGAYMIKGYDEKGNVFTRKYLYKAIMNYLLCILPVLHILPASVHQEGVVAVVKLFLCIGIAPHALLQ